VNGVSLAVRDVKLEDHIFLIVILDGASRLKD
jgi:hypothetical protein